MAKKTAKKKTSERPLGKPHVRILTALAKAPSGLTRKEIAKKTGINSGFTSYLGHLDPKSREPGSLAARGYLAISLVDVEGVDTAVHKITAAGKKALTAAKK